MDTSSLWTELPPQIFNAAQQGQDAVERLWRGLGDGTSERARHVQTLIFTQVLSSLQWPATLALFHTELNHALRFFFGEGDAEHSLQALNIAIELMIQVGQLDDAQDLLGELRDLAEQVQATPYLHVARVFGASLMSLKGQPEEALAEFESLFHDLEGAEEHFDSLRADALNKGIALSVALNFSERARALLAHVSEDNPFRAFNLARIEHVAGNRRRAIEHYKETVEKSAEINNKAWAFQSLLALSTLDAESSDAHLEVAKDMTARIQHPEMEKQLVVAKVWGALHNGRWFEARETLKGAEDDGTLTVAQLRAEVFTKAGPFQLAGMAVDEYLSSATKAGVRPAIARAHLLAAALPSPPEARAQHVREARDFYEQVEDHVRLAECWCHQATLELDLKAFDDASASARKAMDLTVQHVMPDVEAIAWTLLGRVSLAQGQGEVAERNFARGLELARAYGLITVEARILNAQGDEDAGRKLLVEHGAIFEEVV